MVRQVTVGGVKIGGGAKISVQSMCSTDTRDIKATVNQINALADVGCDIVRLAVPDAQAAEAFREIRRAVPNIPLVADIHFDHRLALAAVDAGADKIRINPGNISNREHVKAVAQACLARGIPIRVGANSGSTASLAEDALNQAAILEAYGFSDIILSLKATDISETITANRLARARSDYPLHVGITEAGTLKTGLVKSAAGIAPLLLEGIGDTVRISLSANPVEEVLAARTLLRALGLSHEGVSVIACPTCGRCRVDVSRIAEELERRVQRVRTPLTLAVMGCAVNGPGEARRADYGLAGGEGEFLLFRHGEIVGKVPENTAIERLLGLIS
ncbi:4-hydroxy-3-methylbut-2-en-1-yl diphosphate synthase (flavodoxin) [Clostridia bacterium]|nr:4-hydroxy-3-methylbut-2-en-1-yl diphosphate synthase (flavodoxin) [Clostridia bacterium]